MGWRGGWRAALVCAVVMVWTVLSAGAAAAHPLGNFTVNSLVRVDVAGDTLWVHYVLDQAEVPTLVDIEAAQSDPERFARERAAVIADGLRLEVDGAVVSLTVDDVDLSLPEGEAGMATLRLVVRFAAQLPTSPDGAVREARLSDDRAAHRLGWREMVVGSRGDSQVVRSDVPAEDVADDLRDYPDEMLDSPWDVRTASFTFRLGTRSMEPLPLEGYGPAIRGGDQLGRILTGLVDAPWSAMALVVAFGVGAVHALGPGHGKTMMAAYLIGTRGRVRDALVLAVAVALMHSASVLVLGFAVLHVASLAEPEVVYPWLSLLSGLAVAAVGIHLCRQRFGRASAMVNSGVPGHDHGYGHGHGHAHGHGHGHGHSHGQGADTVSPTSVKGILALASAGGLLPSPAALLVLLGAISVGRMGVGLALVAAFTVGLASALGGVGLFLVYGRDIAERRVPSGRILSMLPQLGAIGLIASGLALAVHAAVRLF
jgi:ABC-type nickel/cobalt efflux system permease component RcnA